MAYTPPAGSAVTLGFAVAYTPPAGASVPLNFTDSTSAADITAQIAATLASLQSNLAGWSGQNYTAAIAATLADASGNIAGVYDVNVWRGKWIAPSIPWGEGSRNHRLIDGGWKDGTKLLPLRRIAWKPNQPVARQSGSGWNQVPEMRHTLRAPWNPCAPASAAVGMDYRYPASKRQARRLPWGAPSPKPIESSLPYRHPPTKRIARRLPWGEGQPRSAEWLLANRTPRQLRDQRRLPWGEGNPPPWTVVIEFPPPPPPPTPPFAQHGNLALLDFRCPMPGHANLNFTNAPCEGARRSVIVINTASMIRLSDSMPIPITSLSLSHDIDSWSWDVQASIADRATLALVAPGAGGPVEVQIGINNYQFTAIIESWGESRAFGNAGYTVSGRSRSALLAAPYSPLKSRLEASARTANQLADDELINTGWTLVWDAPDWLVPAGVYSYQGKTLMDSILAVAQAAGLVVQPDPVEKIIRVCPRYPVSPWAWDAATPDAVIYDYHVISASARWSPKPEYNGVYVSGQNAGVVVYGKRAGTAGEVVAPMVVDALITEVAAGQERARNILADTGKISMVTLSMPVYYTAPGLILPGKLVEVRDTTETWRGMVISVGVDIQNNGGELTATQMLEIERHY